MGTHQQMAAPEPAMVGSTTARGGASRAAMAAPLAPLTLLDLPDDMLNVIASAVNEPAAHVALLGTCKRLRDAVYEAPCSLVVRTPSKAGWRARRRRHFAALAKRGMGRAAARALVEFPTDMAAAAAYLLASVVRFLATHKQVRSLTLYSSPNGADTSPVYGADDLTDSNGSSSEAATDCKKRKREESSDIVGSIGGVADGEGASGSNTAAGAQEGGSEGFGEESDSDETDLDFDPSDPAPWDFSIDYNFYMNLLPILERLPLTSLCVPNLVLTMWRLSPTLLALSATPLRRLQVKNLLRGASWVSVSIALRDQAASLEELTLGDDDFWGERDPDTALSFRLGSTRLPRLTALTLVNLNVHSEAAARMAANYPSLTHLSVRGNWMQGSGAALRFPGALPALTHLEWCAYGYAQNEIPKASSQAAELGAILGGRTLVSLSLGGRLVGSLQRLVQDVVHAWPQLAVFLDLSDMIVDGATITGLCGATGASRLTTVSLSLAPGTTQSAICCLGQLPSLKDLTVRCAEQDWPLPPGSEWPLGQLMRLAVHLRAKEPCPSPEAPLAVVQTLAASPSARSKLLVLALTGARLVQETAAAAMSALGALRCLHFTVLYECESSEEVDRRLALADAAAMRRWVSRTTGVEVSTAVQETDF